MGLENIQAHLLTVCAMYTAVGSSLVHFSEKKKIKKSVICFIVII